MKLSAPNITREDAIAAAVELSKGNLDPGPIAEEFACALADFWAVPRSWVLLTNSCTTAITLATKLFDHEGPWRVQALTWPGSYCAVPYTLVDTDTGGLGLVTSRKALPGHIGVNLFGNRQYKAKCDIVDNAHCLSPTAPFTDGRAYCFSFGPTKEITTIRGGALVHPRAVELEDRIMYNTSGRMPLKGWGLNGTITEVGARLGLRQLERYKEDRRKRHDVLWMYRKLSTLDMYMRLRPDRYSGHLAVFQFATHEQRDRAQELYRRSGIPTSIHYPLPDEWARDFPNAVDMSKRVLTVPCHAQLTGKEIKRLQMVTQRVGAAL